MPIFYVKLPGPERKKIHKKSELCRPPSQKKIKIFLRNKKKKYILGDLIKTAPLIPIFFCLAAKKI